MTGDQFTTALTTLGLDNHQAAQWLGVSGKSVRRYRVSGAPKMAERLLRLALALREAEKEIDWWAEEHGCCYGHQDEVKTTISLALDWRE
jgi:hypothetical protein